MNKKTIFIIGILSLVIAVAAVGLFGLISPTIGSAAPILPGSWKMGPSIDTTLLGCPAGNGISRFTGIYYPEQERVYFLGGRCEDNSTIGMVYYLDLLTRSYHLTQEVLDVPVSNAQMVRIDDDGQAHGPGLYIIGGRTADGPQSNAVQVYYPNANFSEVVESDPFPPAVTYTPGGVVTWNGVIITFGGFDTINMYADTYGYDPGAAAGSRWTAIPCPLPTPRAYIASAVVGNKIYAMGGDEWIGSLLVPINDTVVWNLDDPFGCWQDAGMADLPQVNGDAPAVYVAENYIGGGIFVIGGTWPDPNRRVFRYDLAGDFWASMSDLVIPAPATGVRNEAAVYIPSTSNIHGKGIPGIWIFGGFTGGLTMTNTSEFFANPPIFVTDLFMPLVNRP